MNRIPTRTSCRRGTRSALLALLATATITAGAADAPVVKPGWQPGSDRGQTFHRVLVVGVSPDVQQRCPFERFVVSRLQSASTVAMASCDTVVEVDPLTRESIAGAVKIMDADAVIATILVSREWEAEQGGGRDTRGSHGYKATDAGMTTGYYGAYWIPVVYGDFQNAPPITTMQGSAEVRTGVFRIGDAKLVYAQETKAKKFESRDQALSAIAKGIVDKLRKSGVVD